MNDANREALQIEDIELGSGPEARGRGQTACVHYTGWLEDGTRFDSSRERGEPFCFPLECDFVIPGWDLGIQGMRVGGRRRLVIPPQLAYGERGAGSIPPNATLIFEIELLELSE